jgi:hypothetical protein
LPVPHRAPDHAQHGQIKVALLESNDERLFDHFSKC